MSYQALYRVFRAERFSDVVGQEPIVTTLRNQILQHRVAHAYLFCGSRGTGKTTTARVLARAINCLAPTQSGDPCGECEHCEALGAENNMDVIEIDAASNNGVDEIRELRDKVKYPPTTARYKVYIIDEVHMLSIGAFNAFLKTLEEPPAHAVFILATTEPQKLPATILSRCQRFDFKRIPAAVIVERLEYVLASVGREAENEALLEIARAAEGGMRDALSVLDMCLAYGGGKLDAALVRDVLGASDRRSLFDFADALIRGDAAAGISVIDRQMREGRDAQVFAREAARHMRALMLAQLAREELAELLEITEEDALRYAEQAEGVPRPKLMRVMELFMEAENQMRWASLPRAVLELCAVRACHPEREQGIEALMERMDALEDKLRDGVLSAAPRADDDPGPAAPPPEDAPNVPDAPRGVDAASGSSGVPSAASAENGTGAQAGPAFPAPSGSAGADRWDRVVEAVRERHKALYPPVSSLRFAGVEDDAARLVLPRRWNMYLGVLEQDDKRRLLEQLLSEAFGKPMRALFSLEDAAPKAKSQPAQNTLQQAYELFGRENVSVLDDE